MAVYEFFHGFFEGWAGRSLCGFGGILSMRFKTHRDPLP
jgi:hypothetical protein